MAVIFFCFNFQLQEKKRQLRCLILENKLAVHVYHAKLSAETHKGAYSMQVLLNKQEDKVKVGNYYPYTNFLVHLSYC
jgi:hypothetical protein